MMRIRLVLLFAILLTAPGYAGEIDASQKPPLQYKVDLNDRGDDTFKVTLMVNDLQDENGVYHFAATAPGTYTTMDMGRFVRDFEALDESGAPVATEQISTNQWRISMPETVAQIKYEISETWDTPVDSNRVYPMCGSSIEEDHVQINGQCVFGYPAGMQARPLTIDLSYPADWLLGTALTRNADGYFVADDFDHVVDSPFLLGELSKAELQVDGCDVEIYTYSKTGKVKSNEILTSIEDILRAAADFTDGLPVDRYVFLFHFEDVTVGAWEHSYSSIYTYSENQFEELLQTGELPNHAAHEFFHIVTPLNIHSEIIEQFNFVTPEPSQHLWLYEGATEWAAHIMQLRAGLINLDTYLQRMRQKITYSEYFKEASQLSLTELARRAFSPGYVKMHPDIYMRGAVVAGLLDIRLIELSDGKAGLRDLINKLTNIYGPEKAFPEDNFFEVLAEMTYPEVLDFFEKYVIGNEPLPLTEYYAELGISYFPQVKAEEETPSRGFAIYGDGNHFYVGEIYDEGKDLSVKRGDVITQLFGQEVTQDNFGELIARLKALDLQEAYELGLTRDDEPMTLTLKRVLRHEVKHHVFEAMDEASPQQLALRNAWMQNR